jgi:hypothetical protein
LAATAARPAHAIVLAEDELEETSTAVGAILRSFTFVMAGKVLTPPYNQVDASPTGMEVLDLRLYLEHATPDFKLVVHDHLTTELRSHALSSPLSVGRSATPARWLPLHYEIADERTLGLRRDTDWLYAAFYPGPLTITVGRQPVSFGRGRLWRTADLVSTFSVTEIDTEYKPGADAIRLDWSIDEHQSLSLLAAVGELESSEHDLEASLEGSSFIVRFKSGYSRGELGLIAGLVRYDGVLGFDAALDVGPFDLHTELTATKLTADSLAAPAVEDADVPVLKALVGATLRPADRWTVVPEVYWNGFGAWHAEDYLPVALSRRVGIGEQVALGRLYAGVSNDLELHPLWHLVSAQILNVTDPSGLLLLGLTHNLADNVEVYAGSYLPMGRLPNVGELALRSEYGNYPYFTFVELKGVL